MRGHHCPSLTYNQITASWLTVWLTVNAPPSRGWSWFDGLSYVSSSPPALMDPLSFEALDNHDNQPATGATKVGGGWQEHQRGDHTTTMVDDDKW
jgi:hypothetical protein